MKNTKDWEKIKNALTKNLGTSIPFLEDIIDHIIFTNNNFSRSSFLIQCAGLFRISDQKILDVCTTLEFLHTASTLHRNLNEFESARRNQLYVKNILGTEASVLLGDYLLSISFKILTRLGNLDVLECVSLATKNISRGQVLEINDQTYLESPKHWYKVIRNKIAGLYGAGAKSAAYLGNASRETASKLFSFGEHFGIATQLKKDLDTIHDKKIIQQKLKNQVLWSPLCFLIHDCMRDSERIKILEKLIIPSDKKDISEEIINQFEKFEMSEILKTEARKELRKAAFFVNKLEIDTSKIHPLTIYSNI